MLASGRQLGGWWWPVRCDGLVGDRQKPQPGTDPSGNDDGFVAHGPGSRAKVKILCGQAAKQGRATVEEGGSMPNDSTRLETAASGGARAAAAGGRGWIGRKKRAFHRINRRGQAK